MSHYGGDRHSHNGRSHASSQRGNDVHKMTRLHDQVRDGVIDTRRLSNMVTDTSSPAQQLQRYRDEYDGRYYGAPQQQHYYDNYEYDQPPPPQHNMRPPIYHPRQQHYKPMTQAEQLYNQNDLVQVIRQLADDDRATCGPCATCYTPAKRCFNGLVTMTLACVGFFAFVFVAGFIMRGFIGIWPYLWWSPW